MSLLHGFQSYCWCTVVVVETAPKILFSGVVTSTAPKETELEKTIREQVLHVCDNRYYRCDGCLLLSQRWFLIDEIVNITLCLKKTGLSLT